jgi:hypothetical protein
MSTRRPGVNEGKQAFLEQMLKKNPKVGLEEVVQAWIAAGHEGAISQSYLGKVKSNLGLTKLRDKSRSVASASTKSQTRRAPEPRHAGRPAAAASPERAATRAGNNHDRSRTLDEIESDLDRLMHRMMGVGGLGDAERALRKVRRLVSREIEE